MLFIFRLLFGGPGYNKIKQAPAYTFGIKGKIILRPSSKPNAPLFNIRGQGNKGPFRITHSIVRPQIKPLGDKTVVPGPGAHEPSLAVKIKRPAAYSIGNKLKPPYQPFDMWTPPPNMYHPPMTNKKEPAFTFGNKEGEKKTGIMPGPSDHNINYSLVKRNRPAYSFGGPHRHLKPPKMPAPNSYCEKKFMITKQTIPAPTFGIRHTPFLGKRDDYMVPSNLEVTVKPY